MGVAAFGDVRSFVHRSPGAEMAWGNLGVSGKLSKEMKSPISFIKNCCDYFESNTSPIINQYRAQVEVLYIGEFAYRSRNLLQSVMSYYLQMCVNFASFV